MDDDFELVPKDTISKLKTENDELKKRLETRQEGSKQDAIKVSDDLIKQIQIQSEKERAELMNHLVEIKELSKNTLNNVVGKAKETDERLSNMMSIMNELIRALSDIIDEVQDVKSNGPTKVSQNNGSLFETDNSVKFQIIQNKLEEIEEFMSNLKILLGQIRPSDMKLEKK